MDAEYFAFPTGANPVSVAAGDFNEDGHPDVVTADAGDSTLMLLLGSGGFHLRRGDSIRMDAAPRWVVVRDMNADGHLDLMVVGDFGTSVLLGDGRGGFRIAATYHYPGSFLALGDVNGDGSADIVVTTSYTTTFLFLHGLELSSVGELPYGSPSLYLGDFNEDGHLDLAANGACGIRVWLNNGDGTYDPPTEYTSSCQAGCLEWMSGGDIDGDGHLDLVGINRHPLSCGVLLLGRGDGTFLDVNGRPAAFQPSGPQSKRPPYGPPRRSTGAQSARPAWQTSLIGNGTWWPKEQMPGSVSADSRSAPAGSKSPEGPSSGAQLAYSAPRILLADLNGDGRDESITLSAQGGAELMGRRSLAFPTAAAVADIDSDGNPDVIVAGTLRYNIDGPPGGGVAIHPGDGSGSVRLNPLSFLYYPPVFGELVDVNGDGVKDLAIIDAEGNLNIVLRNPDGSLGRVLGGPRLIVYGWALVDVNSDGRLDVLDWSGSLYLGNGDGTFQYPIRYTSHELGGLDAGDIDGDGKADVVGVRALQNSPAVLLRGYGDGTFRDPVDLGITAGQVKLLDLDGDGHLDLVAARWNDGASVYFGRGDGTFVAGPILGSPGHTLFLQFGDMDGDGRTDLFTIDDQHKPAVYRNTGRGFQRLDSGVGAWGSVADIDGDGRDDILDLGVGTASAASRVFLSNGDGTFREPRQEAYGPGGWSVLADPSGPSRNLYVLTGYLDEYYGTVTVIGDRLAPNHAPLTGNAKPVVSGPPVPDHDWTDVSIGGVTDADGDSVSVEVTGITQDEPVGSGVVPRPRGTRPQPALQCADAAIVNGRARVRWERDGSGNGRVYAIHFTATDGCGGTSLGVVTVCVPHDASSSACVDDGQLYNSLACDGGRESGSPGGDTEQLLPPVVHAGGADLRYALAKATEVRLEIFDLLGRRRAVVASGWQPPGEHLARWQPQGAAGVYFARLTLGRTSYIRSFALLK